MIPLSWDFKLQARYGFWTIYGILSVLYLILIRLLPEEIRKIALPLLIMTDPVVLGFLFSGGLMLLEKSENALASLIVSPLSIHAWMLSKILSLGSLSLVPSLILFFFASAQVPGFFEILILLIALIPACAGFTSLGLAMASKYQTVNAYLMRGSAILVPFMLPALSYILKAFLHNSEVLDVILLIFPSGPASILCAYANGLPYSASTLILSVILNFVWNGLIYLWAKTKLQKYLWENLI